MIQRYLTVKYIALIMVAGFMAASSFAKNAGWVSVENDRPRLTDTGKIVDAHDGRVIQFGNRFYWYGTAYGSTNGFTEANRYVCYSSPDLKEWRWEGYLLDDQPEGVYYRPHVIFNPSSGKYVLWYNWYPKLWEGQFGVAVSDAPTGPFEIVEHDAQVANSNLGVGDFGLFVDDDGVAYLSYNTINGHRVSIERLTKDFTASTLENGGTIAMHSEAGSMFKRNGRYYLLTDYTCCFCNQGSGARVYISDDPLSGYVLYGNINRYLGQPSPALNDGVTRGTASVALSKSESGFQAVEIRFEQPLVLDTLDVWLFTGNRPGTCGEVDDPLVHPRYVVPQFEVEYFDAGAWKKAPDLAVELEASALSVRVRLTLGLEDVWHLRLRPVAQDYPFDQVHLNEIGSKSEVLSRAIARAEIAISGPGIPQRPIIPAQQSYVLQLETSEGPAFSWMGDLWGSASDGIKGHDYQFWSAPLRFRPDGSIETLKWVDSWDLAIE